VLGPRCAGAAVEFARVCQPSHQALRDDTAAAITAAGAVPVAARADYPDLYLYPVPDAGAAARLAAEIEDGCAEAWRYLYAVAARFASGNALRAPAQQALTASTVRAVRWRRAGGLRPVSDPFPGIGS
jgi:hypothetical protein